MDLKATVALALAALSLQACSRDEKGLSGNYTLKGNINGPLPIVLEQNAPCETKLEAGSLTFGAEMSFVSKYHIVQHCALKPDSVMPDPGTSGGKYELSGDTLRFYNEAQFPVGIAIRRADTLKVTGPQHTLVYLKDK